MKPHFKNTIIINLIWILIAFAVVAIWQGKIIKDNKLIYETDLQYQEARNFEKLNEFTTNYNTLQLDYNSLYCDYNMLKLKDGWSEFIITGYSANDEKQGTNNILATTFDLDYIGVQNLPIIATDPDIIPLYSIVEIKGLGAFIALDTGGKIKGNRIDVLFDSKEKAWAFGRQKLFVKVLD